MTFFLSSALFSQPGSIDLSFGQQGKILETTANNPTPLYSIVSKVDNKILAGTGDGKNFIIKQFLKNGVPDSAFGKNGDAETIFYNQFGALLYSINLTESNDIVSAGYSIGSTGTHFTDVLLAKFHENGQPDMSFGDSGKVVFDFGVDEYVNCMKILDNGNILIAGYCTVNPSAKANFFLAEFNSDGSVNLNFGDKGKVITNISTSYQTYINSIAVTTDGSIIAAGQAAYISNYSNTQFILAKYNVDGKLNAEFGSNGIVLTNVGIDADYANAVALQKDGKIVAADVTGAGFLAHVAMAIVRYNNNGSIDSSFNNSGTLSIYFNDDNASANSLIIQSDNKILLGGLKYASNSDPNYSENNFAFSAVTQDGKIDSAFGINGISTTDFSEFQDVCYATALQQDGKILAAGGSTDVADNKTYITIARYNGFKNEKQIIITKIRKWLQHYNGFTWDANSSVSSYAVQRSYDGIHFNSIARIHAGNTSNYTYQDPMPLSGNNYYRLQTTSGDGSVNYSNVITATASEDAIKISPNPAKNVLHIEGLSSTKTKLTVVDFNGNEKMQAVAHAASYNLNIASLKAGNYLLKIEMNGEVVSKKFVKE